LHDDDRALGRAVMVAIVIDTPFQSKGSGIHDRLIVSITIEGAVVKDFEGVPKASSDY
jgi:hypothetical protein